jgi:hypothetical protein
MNGVSNMNKSHGVIVGAYPAAPSFHHKNIDQEVEFWTNLSKNEAIRGIEQPYLDSLHPFGTDFILNNIPEKWDIVITAIMATMGQRKTNSAFGLASTNDSERRACIDYYHQIYEATSRINEKFKRNKIIALQLQSAPDKNNKSVDDAVACFYESVRTIQRWGWSCPLIIEHCDSMTGIAPQKGFLPLEKEIDVARELGISLCINWARSVLETKLTETALSHVLKASRAGVLKSVMFSGTTASGAYGEWGDLHAPFAPFDGSTAGCTESLMTVQHVQDIASHIDLNSLDYIGAKLLEINADADVNHRTAIIHDGVLALKKYI